MLWSALVEEKAWRIRSGLVSNTERREIQGHRKSNLGLGGSFGGEVLANTAGATSIASGNKRNPAFWRNFSQPLKTITQDFLVCVPGSLTLTAPPRLSDGTCKLTLPLHFPHFPFVFLVRDWMHPLDFLQVLGQRFAIAKRERDELRDRFQDSVKQAQQKSGFRNLILEKKLGGLAEESEKRDACVHEVRPSRVERARPKDLVAPSGNFG